MSQSPKVPILSREDVTDENRESHLKQIIEHLSQTIGERNLSKPEKLSETAGFVQDYLETNGYSIAKQEFEVSGRLCANLIAEVVGKEKPREIVLIGSHYDSARGTPGANDNGSGLAAMMVIAKQLKGKQFSRTIRFVAFTNEEPPYFQREGLMGSWVYAKVCRERREDLKVVVSLETLGYFTDEPQSQNFPSGLTAMYPTTGNFIGFVSNVPSRPLLAETIGLFKKHCSVDAQSASLPAELRGVGWSDHWSFWQEGYAGIMVTDTAPFRYPHYHQATDTVDKIEFVRYAKVVNGLSKMTEDLANAKTVAAER